MFWLAWLLWQEWRVPGGQQARVGDVLSGVRTGYLGLQCKKYTKVYRAYADIWRWKFNFLQRWSWNVNWICSGGFVGVIS